MGLNETPSANRLHIGIFGNRNAGKSSLLNAITGQELAIVSDVKGTTTDPVSKAMELLPIGPVVFIDTPGLDDEGELGKKRIEKSFQVLRKIEFAIVVLDGQDAELCAAEEQLLEQLKEKKVPFVMAINKLDAMSKAQEKMIQQSDWAKDCAYVFVSAKTKEGVGQLIECIVDGVKETKEQDLIKDLLTPQDVVILVTPIDAAAPKGRMILPQQQSIRDILDGDAVCMVTKETTLAATLESLKNPPKMVITDSQAFKVVDKIVPKEIPLTSFSILFARKKGDLEQQVMGAAMIGKLKDGDKVLISEGCTHHRQCGDIGTEKLPKLLKKFTGKELVLTFTSGTEFLQDLTEYRLIIHCGGCMLNNKEMKYRLSQAKKQGVAMTNYGVAIAYMNGILERSIELFWGNE